MRKLQKRFIESFPPESQDLIHKWMSESPEHSKIDIRLIRLVRFVLKYLRLFVKSVAIKR